MEVERTSDAVVVELLKHEVTGELQTFRCMHTAAFDADRRLARSWRAEYAQRVNQPMVVEMTIGDAGVEGVTEKIVGPIGAEGIAGHDLCEQFVPWRELLRVARPILQPDGHFGDIERLDRRLHRRPDRPHFGAENDVDRELLVMRACREHGLRAMRERDVAEIVTKGTHSDDGAPVVELLLGWKNLLDVGMTGLAGDYVEDTAGKIHDAETVLETPMCRAGIDEKCQRGLVNVTRALEGARVARPPFVGRGPDERMNRIADLVFVLREHSGKSYSEFRRQPRNLPSVER